MVFKIVGIKWLTHESEEPEAESVCKSERITEFSQITDSMEPALSSSESEKLRKCSCHSHMPQRQLNNKMEEQKVAYEGFRYKERVHRLIKRNATAETGLSRH